MELQVEIVGYRGSQPLLQLKNSKLVHFHYLEQPGGLSILGKLRFCSVDYFECSIKPFHLYLLLTISKPKFMIIQNPPAIPTLFIFQIVSIIRGIPLVIDWHNFGFTIMKVSGDVSKRLLSISEMCERVFGSRASLHITVTKAMKMELKTWSVYGPVTVLYDRLPSSLFDTTGSPTCSILEQV